MAIITLTEMRDYLSFTDDLGTADNAMITGMIDAAQAHIERLLGFTMAATFGGLGQPAVPADLKQAVQMLAALWFEYREAAGGSLNELPFGVANIVREYREYTF